MPILHSQTPQLSAMKSQLEQYIASTRVNVSYRELASLHNTSVTAYVCAELRADTLAQVPFVLKRNGELVEEDHELKEILSQRNGFGEILKRSEWSYCYWGHFLLAKLRNEFLLTRELRWLNPNSYGLDVKADGLEGFYLYRGVYEAVPYSYLARINGVYAHGLDFFDDFDGVSPAEVAFLQAGMESEIAQTLLSFYRNNAIPAAIVQPDKDAKGDYKTPVENLKTFLQRAFKGALNAGRTLVSPVRWEWITLQAPMKDLTLQPTSEMAERAICKAFKIPYELISASASNYAQAEVTRRTWAHLWLVPTAKWYGEQLTRQLASEWSEDLTIEPDLDAVPFLKEDATSRLNVINGKLKSSLISVYDAQKELGDTPDEAFKDLYHVEGFGLVPKSELATLWRYKLTPGYPPTESAAPVDSAPTTQPARPERVSDEVFTELKNWQYKALRKGAKATFECRYIRADVERRLRERLSTAATDDAVKAAFEYARELSAAKAIQATRLDWELDFEDLLAAARDKANPLPLARFRLILRDMLRKYCTQAYRDGLIDGGVTDAEFDDDDDATVNTMLAQQSQYVREIASTLYSEDGKGITDTQAEGRPAMWYNKSIAPFYQAGLLSADKNGAYMWVYGDTEHCSSCQTLNGQVHRLKEYAKRGWLPNSSQLACNGFNCKCQLVKTKERLRGRFPVASAKSHDHDHTHTEVSA